LLNIEKQLARIQSKNKKHLCFDLGILLFVAKLAGTKDVGLFHTEVDFQSMVSMKLVEEKYFDNLFLIVNIVSRRVEQTSQ